MEKDMPNYIVKMGGDIGITIRFEVEPKDLLFYDSLNEIVSNISKIDGIKRCSYEDCGEYNDITSGDENKVWFEIYVQTNLDEKAWFIQNIMSRIRLQINCYMNKKMLERT